MLKKSETIVFVQYAQNFSLFSLSDADGVPEPIFVLRERCVISDFEGRVVLGCWLIEPGRVEVGDAGVQRLRVKLEPERDKGFFGQAV